MIKNTIITLPLILTTMTANAFVATDTEGQENTATQRIQLKKGWNWISFNVQDESMVSLKALKDAGVIYVASRSDALMYDDATSQWYGELTTLSPTEGYSVWATTDATITLSGTPYDVEATVTPIHVGWNWIGYLPQFSQYAINAFHNYPATYGDRITSSDGKGVTYSTSWIGDFALQPGKGYHFYSNAKGNRSLVYNTRSEEELQDPDHKGGADSEFIEIEDSSDVFDAKVAAPDFELEKFDNSPYETDEMLCLKVYIDGEEITDTSRYSVRVYIDSALRGETKLNEGRTVNNRTLFMLRAWGNSSTDAKKPLTFTLFDYETGEEYELRSLYNYNFQPSTIHGTPSSPSALFAISKVSTNLDINLKEGDNLEEIIFSRTGDLTALKSLKVTGDFNIINSSVLHKLKNLEVLDLMGVRNLQLNYYISALEGFNYLHTVKLPAMRRLPNNFLRYCYNLKDVTMMSFLPPIYNNSLPESLLRLHVTGFARPYYIASDYANIVPEIIADQAEAENTDIYVTSATSLLYTEKMAEADFKPNLIIEAPLDLYGETAKIGHIQLGENGSFIPHTEMTVESASMVITAQDGYWQFFSLPFETKVSDIKPMQSGNWVVRDYDSNNRATGSLGNNWKNVPYNTTLTSGKGYIITAGYNGEKYNYFEFNATDASIAYIAHDEDSDVNVREYRDELSSADNWNWNLIGNPYTSHFDISQLDNNAPFLVYDYGKYHAYSPLDDYYILKPGQGFFVQSDGDGVYTFRKEGRCHGYSSNAPFGWAKGNVSDSKRQVLNITLSGTDDEDNTRVVRNAESKAEYEIGRDIAKMMPDNGGISIYSHSSGIRYAIDERPAIDGISIGYTTAKEGIYRISCDRRMVIEDRLLHNTTEIGGEDQYEFHSEAGTFNNRFVVYDAAGVTGIETVTNGLTENSNLFYNITGQRVHANAKGIIISGGRKTVK